MTVTTKRTADLRQMLGDRRREVQGEVEGGLRRGRADRSIDVLDDLEHSDTNVRQEVDRSLLLMRADAVTRIDAALARLDAGKYGSCFDCEQDIAERRLRALPFAVRCQVCEDKRNRRCLGTPGDADPRLHSVPRHGRRVTRLTFCLWS